MGTWSKGRGRPSVREKREENSNYLNIDNINLAWNSIYQLVLPKKEAQRKKPF